MLPKSSNPSTKWPSINSWLWYLIHSQAPIKWRKTDAKKLIVLLVCCFWRFCRHQSQHTCARVSNKTAKLVPNAHALMHSRSKSVSASFSLSPRRSMLPSKIRIHSQIEMPTIINTISNCCLSRGMSGFFSIQQWRLRSHKKTPTTHSQSVYTYCHYFWYIWLRFFGSRCPYCDMHDTQRQTEFACLE